MPDVAESSATPPESIGRSLGVLDGGLGSLEAWWSDQQPWLEEQGYRLRPRYRRGWVPSWYGKKGLRWQDCEDGQELKVRLCPKFDIFTIYSIITQLEYLMDATRISDNAPVLMKAVTEGHNVDQIPNGRLFSSEPLASSPHNHCIPLCDVLEVPNANPKSFLLVMPLLRNFDDPPFLTVAEAVDFFGQIIEVAIFPSRRTHPTLLRPAEL